MPSKFYQVVIKNTGDVREKYGIYISLFLPTTRDIYMC